MELTTLLLFIPACFALNMAPGPNNLLSISHANRFGFARSCAGGVGRLIAFTGMLALASAGLAVVLQTSEIVFQAIKLVGAAYLLYLAYQLWRAPTDEVTPLQGGDGGLLALAQKEFFVAAGNPKAILIFTAFLPQFVNPAQAAGPQFLVLGVLFLLLECIAIALYAYMGLHMRKLLGRPQAKRLFNRVCATLLGGAGVGLLLARRAGPQN